MSFTTVLNKGYKETDVKAAEATTYAQEILDGVLEYCESFNKQTTLCASTKKIIVGTLTPPEGRKMGYFYCSPSPNQKQYFFIDKAKGTKLDYLRQQNPVNISQIKSILTNYNIAFLDVIKCAIASTTSPYDNDIEMFCLDYDAFDKIDVDNTTLIANSQNAYNAIGLIENKLGKTFKKALWYQNARQIGRKGLVPQGSNATDTLINGWITLL